MADAVPGSIVFISVLKPAFSDAEKERLAEFTKWGWKRNGGRPRAQVLLLTGVELFADFDTFAQTTHKIHLGVDYYADRHAQHSAAQ